MSDPREPCRRIVVAGGGPIGILAAIALRKASPASQVVLVSQKTSPASFADWSPTALPFANKLHDRLGIEESEIVLRAGGSMRLVTRYRGWSGDERAGVLPYGEVLSPELRTAFAREWGGAQGSAAGFRRRGSVAEALADKGRFAAPPPDQPSPLADVDYALRWSPEAYRNLLIEKARAAQVSYVEGEIDGFEESGDGLVSAIAIEGQGRIEADFFVDCSGPQARLLASHSGFAFVDWSSYLPTRAIYLGRPLAPVIALEDQTSLAEQGWRTTVNGRDGVYLAVGVAAGVDRAAALRELEAEPYAAISLAPGRAREAWLGNVVAIGDAAARFEPIGPYACDLAHRQLDLLLEILPSRAIAPAERAEYNRRSSLMMDGVRDVLALHFASPATARIFGSPDRPANVARLIDQYERRGRIPFSEENPHSSQELYDLAGALGFRPGLPPAARSGDAAAEATATARHEAAIEAALAYAPRYDQWLESISRGPSIGT